MNPMISVIVPAYNAENTIKRSVDSVIENTFKELEIIVVDDGSKDNTCKIVKSIIKEDERVKLISKKNGGVSSARNLGIQKASAPYIMFLDSDDTYEPTCCEKTANQMLAESADIVLIGYNECFKYQTYKRYCPVKSTLISNDEIFESLIHRHYMSGLNGYMGSVWLACFKKDIIQSNNIAFNEKLHHSEDKLFLINYLFCCQSLAVVNEALYNYNLGDSSVTKKYSPDLEVNQKNYSQEWEALLNRYGHGISVEQKRQGAITYVISIILNEVREGNPKPFLKKIRKVVDTSKENKDLIKQSKPESRSLRIKRFITMHPSMSVMFYLTRRAQRALGVYF